MRHSSPACNTHTHTHTHPKLRMVIRRNLRFCAIHQKKTRKTKNGSPEEKGATCCTTFFYSWHTRFFYDLDDDFSPSPLHPLHPSGQSTLPFTIISPLTPFIPFLPPPLLSFLVQSSLEAPRFALPPPPPPPPEVCANTSVARGTRMSRDPTPLANTHARMQDNIIIFILLIYLLPPSPLLSLSSQKKPSNKGGGKIYPPPIESVKKTPLRFYFVVV